MEVGERTTSPAAGRLAVGDAISLMIGIVIGASLYETPPEILKNVSGPWVGIGVWVLGGLLSLAGALCYAELASTYPGLGGDYIYLGRAYGPWMGFLFGWAQLAVIRTANIGMLAFVFARYAGNLWGLSQEEWVALAVGAVLALSLLNILGVVLGKWTQNVLTAAKVVGLAGIVAVGFAFGHPDALRAAAPMPGAGGIGAALIFVLYAYGGWSDAAFVAAELRRPAQIARALILGTAAITLIYVAVNAAYIVGLGFEGARTSEAVAAELLDTARVPFGGKAMCVLVMVSALGSINGTIFAGARVYAALGTDHAALAWLGRWGRSGSPLGALVAQALISIAMILAVGTAGGHRLIDGTVTALSFAPLKWEAYDSGFKALLIGTGPVFWVFFLLTAFAVFVLRRKDRAIERPFMLPSPLSLLVPLVFAGTSAFMFYATFAEARHLAIIGAVPLCLGLPLYFVPRRGRGHKKSTGGLATRLPL
jgi:amino acid transporter